MRAFAFSAGLLAALSAGLGATGSTRESWTEPRTGMEFVTIRAGAFLMGSPPTEKDREAQEVQHEVTLTRDFSLGVHEVTQGQWRRVMGANPSHFADRGEDFPVERVNFLEIAEFIRRMNERSTSRVFRLPTEAEWEYACRAGTATAFATGDALLPSQANFLTVPGGPQRGTTRVGSFPPNAWGLHDMHGNVWEWTSDHYCPYPQGAVRDPAPQCESGLKVIRGGSWYFGADSARCALRYTHPPKERGFSLGFRLAADLK